MQHMEIYTCHDNLLSDLYSLGFDTVYYKEINNQGYLINSIKAKNYEIGLRVKVDKLNYPQEVNLMSLYTEDMFEHIEVNMLLELYSKYLVFTNIEKYITNVLLDKYFSNETEFEISLKEIEIEYRKRASSYRNITLNTQTFKRYINTIDALCNKELYLITNNKFRHARYGVNNLSVYQDFLTITDSYKASVNNIAFSYSFRAFGNILKSSKRYSTLVSPGAYRINFNQVKYHLVAFEMARIIFIQQGLINRYPLVESNYTININIQDFVDDVEERTLHKKKQNKLRHYKMIAGYIEATLETLKHTKQIEDYTKEFDYYESENFTKKYEFEYDNDLNLCHEFTLDDLDEDVSVSYTIIMPGLFDSQYANYCKEIAEV